MHGEYPTHCCFLLVYRYKVFLLVLSFFSASLRLRRYYVVTFIRVLYKRKERIRESNTTHTGQFCTPLRILHQRDINSSRKGEKESVVVAFTVAVLLPNVAANSLSWSFETKLLRGKEQRQKNKENKRESKTDETRTITTLASFSLSLLRRIYTQRKRETRYTKQEQENKKRTLTENRGFFPNTNSLLYIMSLSVRIKRTKKTKQKFKDRKTDESRSSVSLFRTNRSLSGSS
jgi:hypothetical protein